MKISGMADRAASEVMQLGPDVEVPVEVPVRVNFHGAPVGRATLRRDVNGDIYAEAEIVDPVARQQIITAALDHFAVGVKSPNVASGMLTTDIGVVHAGTVTEVSVVERNIDPDQPPFVVDAS